MLRSCLLLYCSFIKPRSIRNELRNEQGNILIIILITIALIAALTAAIQGSSSSRSNVDKETLILRATQLRQHAAELERGVHYVMQNGVSENDIRFAHPLAPADYGDLASDTDRSDQIFSSDGGNAKYNAPPDDINNGDNWEFFGQTTLPDVGSDEAELVAVLPNVTEEFCAIINESLGYDGQPEDSGTCINAANSKRFSDSTQFDSSPDTTNETSFSTTPAKQGCVKCTNDNSYHFFYVLMSR
ncbi:MAG: hypothetical protein KAJ40_00370 [Alphaproteobacteria bacterium]|nr:hypothetical protein [Alphaproteobacteria bacterium]